MNELMKPEQEIVSVWEKPEEIRKLLAPNLTDTEFQYFMGVSKLLGANPLKKEIWAVKYGNAAAQVFCGRDFYRRKAQEQPDFKGHIVDAVHEKDTFELKREVNLSTSEIKVSGLSHTYNATRGKLIGAYCIVLRDKKVPTYVYVPIEEYLGKTKDGAITKMWKEKPETMIKKVAESLALRAAYQGIFAGSYSQDEAWKDSQIPTETIELADQKADDLEAAYLSIQDLWDEYGIHEKHRQNSMKHHLGVARLSNCRDIEKLRTYWKERSKEYKVEQQKKVEKVAADEENLKNGIMSEQEITNGRDRIIGGFGNPSKELAAYDLAVGQRDYKEMLDLIADTY